MNVVVNVVSFFCLFVGSVECRRCFEGVLSSDAILKDCMTNQPSFSQVLLTYTRVEPTKFQLGPTDQSFELGLGLGLGLRLRLWLVGG